MVNLEISPTVLVADDDPAFSNRVHQLIESEFQVLATVGDGQALLAAARQRQPDLYLVDISMPRLNGFQAARLLKKEQPNARILFLTVHEEPAAVEEALAIGVSGYILKRSAAADLIPALRQVLQGGRFVSAAIHE